MSLLVTKAERLYGWKEIAKGRDGTVFSDPRNDGIVIKAYPKLSLKNVREYHRIQNTYAVRGEIGITIEDIKIWYLKDGIMQQIKGIVLRVLAIPENDIEHNKWLRCNIAKVTRINGENLDKCSLIPSDCDKQYIEELVRYGCEFLGLCPKRVQYNREGHEIHRVNIMISDIINSVLHITLTDIAGSIKDSLIFERARKVVLTNL